ncbi:MAG TPA: M56 family metallopeptidase [Tepidisphaeraceae bacterium]|jgi:beta-lactamase regulating signal transducer with metallopeptidase domain|nr:M56 family metallopeptidase [Tepidisphaeraceae bacterium]
MSIFPAVRSISSTPAVERLAWTLIHSLWEFALIAIVAMLAAAAMRRASAAARYALLVAAMMLATLAPVATWLLQPTFAADSAPATSGSATAIAPPIATRTPADAINTDWPSLNDRAFDRDRAAGPLSRATFPARPATALGAPGEVQPAHPSRLAQIRAVLHPWFGWMVAAWCLGVALCSLRPLFGLLTLGRLRQLGTSPAADEVLAAADRMSRRLGLRRAVLVMHSACARAPLVIGYLRPIILIPIGLATGIPARQLQAILAHELAHVRRHDFLVNLLQTLVETLFFYHPGIWLLSRRIRIEREHCCDDLAMELLGSRVEYGRALLAIEEMRGQSGILALGAHGGSLVTRIRRIAAGSSDRKVASLADRWPAALLGLAVIGATCIVALHRSLAADDASRGAAGTRPEQIVSPPQTAVAPSAKAEGKASADTKPASAPETGGAKKGAARDGDAQAADAAELAEALLKDPDYTELRADLSELQLSNAEIVARLGSKHPRYIAMKHRVEAMEQKLSEREEVIKSRLAEAKRAKADAAANAIPAKDAPADASTPSSRTFALRFRLASESADDLRQILLGRPGNEAKISGDNQAITIIAPPDVIGRAQTFIAVTDWPDSITRQSNFNYPRESVTRTARSFFYACAIQDTQEVFDKMLSPGVLAELKGDTKSEEYENYMQGALPDAKWEKQLRGDWPGKKQALERMVNEWNRYPLRRLTEEGGVAIGFGEKHFCSVSFHGAPKDFYEVMIEPDRVQHAAGKEAYFFSSLPPWWKDKPADGASPPRPDGGQRDGDAKPHSEGGKPNTAPLPAVAPPDKGEESETAKPVPKTAVVREGSRLGELVKTSLNSPDSTIWPKGPAQEVGRDNSF